MVGPRDYYSAAFQFQPERLTIARELRGLTKSELAVRVEKTPSAISQFEAGRTKPDAHTLARLALVLRVQASFFVGRPSPGVMAIDECHFRSLRSASQRDRRQLLATGSLASELVSRLERDGIEFPEEQVSPHVQPARSVEDIEHKAASVREAWGLGMGPIPNLVRLLETKGILVLQVQHGSRRVDAFSLWSRGRPLVFLVMEKGSTSRTRFDGAHELGHLLLHPDPVPASAEAEREADRFASAFLLPAKTYGPECPTRFVLTHFLELKTRWRVSVAALVRRGYELGRLSKASYRRAFVQLNRIGRQNEPAEPAREIPSLLPRALEMLSEDVQTDDLSAELGFSVGELLGLMTPSDEQAELALT